ncbi:MAG: hypothetical protein S0880_16355 [Actinomycetota bacterium]|nr:hypothetical protein [Actinomycetota bacterium]
MDDDLAFFDPRGRAGTDEGGGAPRLASLRDVPIGLLSNGKHNAAVFLGYIADLLRERDGVGDVRTWEKVSASVPAPDPMLAEMRARARLVLTGIGD